MKKIFGFNLDVELKERLKVVAIKKYTSSSALLNEALKKYLDEYEGIVKEIKEINKPKELTPKQIKDDWDWRKGQVAKGEMPEWFGEEFPKMEELGREDVYLTPDGLPRNGRVFKEDKV